MSLNQYKLPTSLQSLKLVCESKFPPAESP